jgi:hypothetical protein
MTDVVDKLRALVRLQAIGEGAAQVHKRGLAEAAAEIERLRAALGVIKSAETVDHAREIARTALKDASDATKA